MANPARATLTDLANLAPGFARISSVPSAKQQAALNAASDWLDGQLRNQYALPLTPPYPQDVIDFEVIRAAYRMLLNVGINTDAPGDKALLMEYERQMAWAEAVGRGEQGIANLDPLSGSDGPSGPEVITSTSRGYSERGFTSDAPPSVNSGPFSDD